jgi:hypothetical protein
MNEVEWIKSLDRFSSNAPRVDVTTAVMERVRSTRRADRTVLSIAAVFAVAAGVTAILLAMPLWVEARNPLAGFTDAFNLVLQ